MCQLSDCRPTAIKSIPVFYVAFQAILSNKPLHFPSSGIIKSVSCKEEYAISIIKTSVQVHIQF